MNGPDRQAYDRGVTLFSPDGRLYQVDYAREAVKQGSASVGVRTDDGVVLAAHKPRRSELVERRSVEKLHPVDDHVAVATAGHAADARRLVDVARRAAQRERLQYGQPASVETLATAVSDHVQEHTQSGGARPYGTALLIAGYEPDAEGGEPGPARLFETDPSGSRIEWRATAVGRDSEGITAQFEDRYGPDLGLEDGLSLAVSGLARSVEDPDPASVTAGTVSADGFRRVDDERLEAALADADGRS